MSPGVVCGCSTRKNLNEGAHGIGETGKRRRAKVMNKVEQSLQHAEKSLDVFRERQKKIYEHLTTQLTSLEVQ